MKQKKKVKRLDLRRRAWERQLSNLNKTDPPQYKRPGSWNK